MTLSNIFNLKKLILGTLLLIMVSCTSFVDTEPGNGQLSTDTVFESAFTVESALTNIYAQLRDTGLISGTTTGASYLLGLYTDELRDFSFSLYFQNDLAAEDFSSTTSWFRAYEAIFQLNFIMEGVASTSTLTNDEKDKFIGEALCLRSFLHLLLTELYGDVPYVDTADRVINESISKTSKDIVYLRIIEDLNMSKSLLEGLDINMGSSIGLFGRSRVDSFIAEALLARANLYRNNWMEAAENASVLIDNFVWETNLNTIFLKESSTAIFQLTPQLDLSENTREGQLFFIQENAADLLSSVALTDNLLAAFETDDQRQSSWVGFRTINGNEVFFSSKYKQFQITPAVGGNNSGTLEFSVILRLAEQYLIRAEARARLGDIAGAQADINIIRTRAGLPNTTASTTEDLIDAVLQERRIEFFAEQGHRFFDLKRTNKANMVLQPVKPNWTTTDLLFPISVDELDRNPNLLPQNPGY